MSRHACWIQWDGRDQQLTCENTALRGWAREGGLTWQNETGWHAKRQGLPSVCNILSIIWYWLPWNLLTAWKWFWQTFELESALCFLFFLQILVKTTRLNCKTSFPNDILASRATAQKPQAISGGKHAAGRANLFHKIWSFYFLGWRPTVWAQIKVFFFLGSSSLRIAKLQLSEPDRVEITPNSLKKMKMSWFFPCFD